MMRPLILALLLLASACAGGPATDLAASASASADPVAHAGVTTSSAADRVAGSQLQQTLISQPDVSGWQGAVLSPAVPKPDLTLTATDGQPFDFIDRTADAAVTFLYFGFTTCPDICPSHMASLAAALRTVPDEVADQVAVVFISVDPERDEPVLRQYLDSFDPSFEGLTGTPAEVNAVMRDLGVIPSAIAEDGPFPPSHPVNIIAFAGDASPLAYPFGIHGGAIAEDLVRLVTEGFSA